MRLLFALLFSTLVQVAAMSEASAACERKAIIVKNIERDGIVCTPNKTEEPMPLLLVFHGHGSSGKEMAVGTRLHEAWPEAMVVYLNGLTGTATPNDEAGKQTGWQINPGDMGDRDVAFVDGALDALQQHYRIDPQRIFAAGHSNGARFIGVLWAMRGQRFAGFGFSAAQADTLMEKAPLRSAWMGMGTHDEVVPYAWQKNSIPLAAQLLQLGDVQATEGLHQYRNQDGLELVTLVHTGGHIWPPGQTKLMVDFFRRHHL